MGQDVEGLEHEADAVAAQQRARVVIERLECRRRRWRCVPESGDIEAGDKIEQRRLADARFALDRHELAAVEP